MYSTVWCGYCKRLKTALKSAGGISFAEVDIEHDPEAAKFVMSVNNGNQTVPTVKFADGSALTNPQPQRGSGQAGVVKPAPRSTFFCSVRLALSLSIVGLGVTRPPRIR